MVKEERNNKQIIYIALSFIVVFLINGIYIVLNNITNTDEFSSIGTAAFMAGKDWSDLMQISSFHGFGFTVLGAPFFRYFSSGAVLYKTYMTLMLCLRLFTAYMIFRICCDRFNRSLKQSFLITIVCMLGILTPEVQSPISVMSEVPFCAITIFSIFCFSKYLKNNKYIYLLLMALIMLYGYFIHSRAIILYCGALAAGAVYCLLVIKEFKNARTVIKLVCFMAVFIIGLLLAKEISKFVVNGAYGGGVKGTASAVMKKSRSLLLLFTDKEIITNAFNLFFSLLTSFVFYSFGFITFWILIIIGYWTEIIKNIKNKVLPDNTDKALFICSLFSVLCFFGMNFAIAISSNGSLATGNYRWFTYIRYALPFAMGIVLCAEIAADKIKTRMKRICAYSVIINLLLMKWFISNTAAFLDESGYKLKYSVFNSYSFLQIFGIDNINQDSTPVFVSLAAVTVFAGLLTYLCFFTKKPQVYYFVYLLLSLIVYFQVFGYSFNRDSTFYSYYNSSLKVMNSVCSETEDISVKYCGSNKFCIYFRLSVPNEELKYIDIEDDINDNDIVFSDMELELDSYRLQLDDNEYVYYKNTELLPLIEKNISIPVYYEY